MNYRECIEKINELIEENLKIKKQSYIMFIPQMEKMIREIPTGEEVRVRYDISKVWDEFKYLEDKTIYFINKYLTNLLQGIEKQEVVINRLEDSSTLINNFIDEGTYYFDAFVASFYSIIEPIRKEYLKSYLNKQMIENIFPNRNEVGLYWQVYNLRNRIIHFTSGRYAEGYELCERYEQFSSKSNMIEVKNNNIHIKTSLIDLYKCKALQAKVIEVIKTGEGNPFDKLFPNQTAKGYGKNKPYMMHIGNDIWFDHFEGGIELVNNIHYFFNKMNYLFLNEFLLVDDKKEETMNKRTRIYLKGKETEYSLKDVFPEIEKSN